MLSLDPGETTGWALFRDGELVSCGQERFDHVSLLNFIHDHLVPPDKGDEIPVRVVAENYRVYGDKRDQHVGSEVVTIQLLGVIKLACQMFFVPLTLQMAWQAKGFQTDEKLKAWGLYQSAKRHANDAIRHACYYFLFHK